MAKLLKTTQPYWLGNRLIPADTVFPEGHPDAIEQYVVEFEVPDPVVVGLRGGAKPNTDEIFVHGYHPMPPAGRAGSAPLRG